MIVFTDVFTGDEVLSDAYKLEEQFEGVVFKAEACMVVKTDDFADEEDGDTSEKVINIVDSFSLRQMPEFKSGAKLLAGLSPFIKRLRKHIKKTNPDRLPVFKAQAEKFLKEFIVPNVKELDVYKAEGGFEEEDMPIFCMWNDDGQTMSFFYFKDGLKGVKC